MKPDDTAEQSSFWAKKCIQVQRHVAAAGEGKNIRDREVVRSASHAGAAAAPLDAAPCTAVSQTAVRPRHLCDDAPPCMAGPPKPSVHARDWPSAHTARPRESTAASEGAGGPPDLPLRSLAHGHGPLSFKRTTPAIPPQRRIQVFSSASCLKGRRSVCPRGAAREGAGTGNCSAYFSRLHSSLMY